jgi:hypothetical protein
MDCDDYRDYRRRPVCFDLRQDNEAVSKLRFIRYRAVGVWEYKRQDYNPFIRAVFYPAGLTCLSEFL